MQAGHAAEKANIHDEQLECPQVLIGFKRYARRIDTADLMNKPAVGEPHDGGLVFFRPPALADKTVYEFLVFFGKLGGDAVPYHADLRYNLIGRVLGKVLLIGGKNALLNLTHLVKILVFGKTLHCFRHTADEIVVLECVDIGLLERGDHLVILLIQQLRKALVSRRHQELLE